MANWDVLNKEFNKVIDNLTVKDWNDWYNNIDKQKNECKIQMLLDMADALNKLNLKVFNKTKNKMETKKEKKFRIYVAGMEAEVMGVEIKADINTNKVYVMGSDGEIVAIIPSGILVYEVKEAPQEDK